MSPVDYITSLTSDELLALSEAEFAELQLELQRQLEAGQENR